MRTTALASQLAVALSLFASACATQTDDEFAQDAEAAAAAASGGKADAPTDFVRLERTTSAEMLTRVVSTYSAELTECAAKADEMYPDDHPSTALDFDNVGLFTAVAIHTNSQWCRDSNELEQIVYGVLDYKDTGSMSAADIVAAIPAWVTDSLAPASASGYIELDKVNSAFLDSEVRGQQDANATSREQDSAGVSFASVRTAWTAVGDETSADSAFLNPVVLPHAVIQGSTLFRYLRAAFPLDGLKLVATKTEAVAGFTSDLIGNDTSSAWTGVATQLGTSSIKKRFLFADSSDEGSASVLIVIDSHDQAWGFSAIYIQDN